MAGKQVEKTGSKAIQKGGVIPGLEGVGQDLLIIPRLKLVQKNSVEVDDGHTPGSIINSVSKEVIAKKGTAVIIIPVLNNRTRIFFKPFDQGGGINCQSFDGIKGTGTPGGDCHSCPENQWDETKKTGKRKSPPCTEYLNVFSVIRGYDFPIPLTASFGRTSMGAGKQLVNFFWADAQKAQLSPWNFAYKLTTELQENEFGKFYVFKALPGGKAQAKEIKNGEVFYNLIKSTTIQVHEDEQEIRREQDRMHEDTAEDPDENPFKK